MNVLNKKDSRYVADSDTEECIEEGNKDLENPTCNLTGRSFLVRVKRWRGAPTRCVIMRIWFKVEKNGIEYGYKIVFCPSFCSSCRVACGMWVLRMVKGGLVFLLIHFLLYSKRPDPNLGVAFSCLW
ncbi:hypothetical protein Vadar_031578 [Vaccinium darrowii]|uniref:Uncharacterized protein n=1 Tax=Vaccinium darrowii TaxID=229202 RepID=A0ACB7YHS3_9ERIC|nr:hypothetical protein Vadar_031578 [Vaccinium darrowii]